MGTKPSAERRQWLTGGPSRSRTSVWRYPLDIQEVHKPLNCEAFAQRASLSAEEPGAETFMNEKAVPDVRTHFLERGPRPLKPDDEVSAGMAVESERGGLVAVSRKLLQESLKQADRLVVFSGMPGSSRLLEEPHEPERARQKLPRSSAMLPVASMAGSGAPTVMVPETLQDDIIDGLDARAVPFQPGQKMTGMSQKKLDPLLRRSARFRRFRNSSWYGRSGSRPAPRAVYRPISRAIWVVLLSWANERGEN